MTEPATIPDELDPWQLATAVLSAIASRARAATPGPWYFDESADVWRLHGTARVIPAHGLIPAQQVTKQILKAPKNGTPYMEYWPDDNDAAFIVRSRGDVERLLVTLEAVLRELDRAEHDALSWDPPLPIPAWVRQIRDVIAREMSREPFAIPAQTGSEEAAHE